MDFPTPKAASKLVDLQSADIPVDVEQLNSEATSEASVEEPSAKSLKVEGRADLDSIIVTESDLDRHFEAVLAQVSYTETIPLFRGKARVVVRLRTAAEASEALNAATKSIRTQENATVLDYQSEMSKWALAYTIHAVETDTWKIQLAGTIEERAFALSKLPVTLYSALLIAATKFNQKAEKIALLAAQPNF